MRHDQVWWSLSSPCGHAKGRPPDLVNSEEHGGIVIIKGRRKLITGDTKSVDETFYGIVMWCEEDEFRALVVDADRANCIVGDDSCDLQDLADSKVRMRVKGE